MVTPTRVIAVILGAGLAAALAAHGVTAAAAETTSPRKLLLRVTPTVSSAPSNLIVTAIIAKDPANRWLTIEADSGTFYRSSAFQLDGDRAPAVTEIRLSNLPSGDYAITAVLRNNLGEETKALLSARVLARYAGSAF